MAAFYKTVFTCDICNDATFPTMEEAVLHESSCLGPANPNRDIPQAADDSIDRMFYSCNICKILFVSHDAATVHETTCTDGGWESCSVCRLMRFRSAEERVAHEGKCGGFASCSMSEIPLFRGASDSHGTTGRDVIELQSSDEGEGGQESGATKKSGEQDDKKLQYSKVGQSTTEASEQHSNTAAESKFEAECEARKSSSARSEQPSKELPGQHAAESSENNEARKDGSGENNKNNNTNEKDGRNVCPEGFTTVWSCDFCRDIFPEKKFDDYDEALEHEKICEYNPDNKKSKVDNNNDNPTSSPTKMIGPASKKITLLSPIMSASDATTESATKPSSHFCLILQSLDLLYHPYSALVSFHCCYCKNQLPLTGFKWNVNRVVEVLPNMTTKHLLGDELQIKGCAAAPSQVVEKLQSVDNVESSRVRTFETFIQSYLAEKGVEARKTDKSLVYSRALVADGKYSPGNLGKKRRASDNNNNKTGDGPSSPSKKQKDDVDVYPPSLKVKIGNMGAVVRTTDDGNQFYTVPAAPLDGVPLVSSITSEVSKKLPLPLQLLLQQVEFFNLSSEPTPNNAVGMRCQNCLSNHYGCGYIPLTSTKELSSDLLAMATDHLIYCRFTKSAVRNKLKDLTPDNHTALKKYCQLITKLYGLENSSNKRVVYGKCPSIPSGYIGSPNNINIDFALI